MIAVTRTDKHRADPTKSGGVVYTSPALAHFLASQAFDALGDVESVRVLDPACGDGELLLATLSVADARRIRVVDLVGYDIDHSAVEMAAVRLNGLAPGVVHCDDFLELAARNISHPELFDATRTSQHLEYDLVISNPPYVRTQTLGAKVAQSLGRRFGLTGRVDLYQAFAIAMIQALVPGGALGLLCSNKFLTNRAGKSMRQFLLNELEIEELVDLGDTKLFEASVLPVIVSGRRSGSLEQHRATRRFRSVYEVSTEVSDSHHVGSVLTALSDRRTGFVSDGARTFVIRDGVLDDEADSAYPWNPVDAATRRCFEILKRASVLKLGELTKIRVGVKTTADSVFIRSDWLDLPMQVRPESELLHPIITHKDVGSWSCEPGRNQILYPHRDKDQRTVAVDLAKYPRAAAYLEQNRKRLEGRKYVVDSGRSWFEIWVPQRPSLWSHQKIVFPDIAASPRFAIDRSGSVVNGDCYWMVIDDDALADVIEAVGNSSFCTWFYDVACGNFLYSGRRRFMTQYIERLPIPDPTPDLVNRIRELRAVREFDAIDAAIWSALGLKQPHR